MKRPVAGCLVLLALNASITGCASAQPAENPQAPPPPSGAARPNHDAASRAELETLAVQTLRDHLGTPGQDVQVVSLEPIDWPDSSMGCPKPDRSYTQVITPGHKAVLSAGGVVYQVHMAGKRAFVCDSLGAKIPKEELPSRELALSLERLQTLARNDLARQLGVPVAEISATASEPTVWVDSSLGCPAPGESYKTLKSKGYVLKLAYRDKTYTYHTDRYRVLPCPAFEKS